MIFLIGFEPMFLSLECPDRLDDVHISTVGVELHVSQLECPNQLDDKNKLDILVYFFAKKDKVLLES
jgi:hypothetical protein